MYSVPLRCASHHPCNGWRDLTAFGLCAVELDIAQGVCGPWLEAILSAVRSHTWQAASGRAFCSGRTSQRRQRRLQGLAHE